MKKNRTTKNRRPAGGSRDTRRMPGPAGLGAIWRNPVFGVAARFIGITVILVLVSLAPFYQTAIGEYAAATARSAAWVANALGESAHVAGTSVWSRKFSVTVAEGCCAAECAWFIIAGILSVPASWGLRIMGAVLGSALIAALNVLRVASLFWIGIRAHAAFRAVHEEAWPLMMAVAALLFVAIWLNLTARRRSAPDAAA